MAQQGEGSSTYSTKKCYECFSHLPLNATVCTTCKKKVGPVDRNGLAQKPTDWKAYIIFGISFAVLVGFLIKAFTR